MKLSQTLLSFARAGFVASLPLWIAATGACSDDADPSGGAGSGGASGAASSGGSPSTGGAGPGTGGLSGESSTGGSVGSGGASTGGMTAKGGTNGSGGATVDPGEPCSANCPTGTVHSCFDDCPLGACDDSGFFASALCSTVYPSPLSSATIYCSKGQTATYCLSAIDRDIFYYVISCAAGKPTVTNCDNGCGVESSGVASCNN